MKLERYESLIFSDDFLEFTFYSVGPQGRIPKVIQFKKANEPDFYNLAFGNLLPDGRIDDVSRNDNKDRNKILATVASVVYKFTDAYPDTFVFFTGSTQGRIRLYRMALTIHYQELSPDFNIYGLQAHENTYFIEPFEKGKDYSGFAVKRKFT